MRILLCISTLTMGGSERQLTLLASELARSGDEVHVIYRMAGHHLDLLKQNNVMCHELKGFSNYSPLIFPRYWLLVRKIKPDVIHSWLEMMDILAGTAALLFSIPWIASERSGAIERRGIIGRLRNFFVQRANCIIANSKSAQQRMLKQGFRPPLYAIPNCVGQYTTLPLLPPKPPLRLITISRLVPTKNFTLLFEALALLNREGLEVRLTVIGDGQLREALEQHVSELKLREVVTFMGERTDVKSYLMSSNAFISVSLLEGQPNSVLEAGAIGIPLILSDIASHRESVDEQGALFCDGTKAASIAEAIRSFICEELKTTDMRRAFVQAFLATRSVEKTAASYRERYCIAQTPYEQSSSRFR